MHPALRLVRIGNVGVSFLGTLVGGLAAAGLGLALSGNDYLDLGLAAVSTACVTAGGNVLNDYLDRETDRTNHPDRPLVTGEVRAPQARALAVGLFVVGAACALPIVPSRPLLGVILLVAVAALLGYELRFKASGTAGNLLVAFLTGAVFLYGAAALGAVVLVLPFGLMAFFATWSREVIKDMEDAGGDVDRRTLPRTRGMGFAAGVARVGVGTAIALSPLPLLYLLPVLSVAGLLYLVSVVLADVVFVASVATLPVELHRAQSLSKLAMTVALLAFLASAFR